MLTFRELATVSLGINISRGEPPRAKHRITPSKTLNMIAKYISVVLFFAMTSKSDHLEWIYCILKTAGLRVSLQWRCCLVYDFPSHHHNVKCNMHLDSTMFCDKSRGMVERLSQGIRWKTCTGSAEDLQKKKHELWTIMSLMMLLQFNS